MVAKQIPQSTVPHRWSAMRKSRNMKVPGVKSWLISFWMKFMFKIWEVVVVERSHFSPSSCRWKPVNLWEWGEKYRSNSTDLAYLSSEAFSDSHPFTQAFLDVKSPNPLPTFLYTNSLLFCFWLYSRKKKKKNLYTPTTPCFPGSLTWF